jgi:hypothetical protein
LGEGNPARVWRKPRVGERNPLETKGFSGGAFKLPREHLGAARDDVEKK